MNVCEEWEGSSTTEKTSMTQSISLSWSKIGVKITQKLVSSDKLSNYDLIVRCQQGSEPERTAFTELVRRYQAQIDRILYHLAPDWADRNDLAQEVWIKVYRNIKKLHEPNKFQGWLSRIATNAFYDELRKRKKATERLMSLDAPRKVNDDEIEWELPSPYPEPEDNLTTREFYEQLNLALKDLPEIFRTTIILREIEGMAYEEIAELTGSSLGTVKSRIARARAKLQSALQPFL